MTQKTRSRIAIVTDSAVCLPQALIQQHNIHVVPFQLIWDGRSYRDGIGMTPSEFYRYFRDSSTPPSTAQPTLGDFEELYAQLGKEAEGIVSIHVPERLSSTIPAAHLAAEQASPVPVRIIDAHTAATAQGFVVLAAARAAESGAGLEQVVSVAEEYTKRVGLFASLQTLEHLHRGGRIGRAAALLGSRLRVYPILYLAKEQVRVAGIARSRQKAKERILELMSAHVGLQPIRASVFHADALDEAHWMARQVQGRFRCLEFFISEFTPVMGAHTGPGTIGVAFCLEGGA